MIRNTNRQTLLIAKLRLARYISATGASLITIIFPSYLGYQSYWFYLPLLGAALTFLIVEKSFIPANLGASNHSSLQVLGVSSKTERRLKIALVISGILLIGYLVFPILQNII